MGAGASFNADEPEDIQDIDLVSTFAADVDNSKGTSNVTGHSHPPPPRKAKKVVLVGVFLRDPTHNVPDKFHSNFFVDSKKGALIKGNR